MGFRRNRLFSSGSLFLLTLMVVSILLVGCSSVDEQRAGLGEFIGGLKQTASNVVAGAVDQLRGVVNTGKALVGSVQEGIDDVKRRADAVQSGVEKIAEGKKLIKEGLGN